MHFPFLIESLMKPLLIPFGANAESSFADLKNDTLTLKFGKLFEQTFELKKIAGAQKAEWPLYKGLGHRIWFGKQTGVLASTRNVVCIHFKEPLPVKALLGLYYESSELYLALEDPDRFISALNEAVGTR